MSCEINYNNHVILYCKGSIKRVHAAHMDKAQYVVACNMINVLYLVEGEQIYLPEKNNHPVGWAKQ